MNSNNRELISSIGNTVQQHVENKKYMLAESEINKYQEVLIKSPQYYQMHSFIKKHQNQLYNAWLWLWRGIEAFPDDLNLKMEMAVITEILKRKDAYHHSQHPDRLHVLHGTMEIANQMSTLSRALEDGGISSKTLSYYQFYLNYTSDYTWNISQDLTAKQDVNKKLLKLAQDFASQYDLFHFHFGTSLTFDFSDIPLLKREQKPIIMQHWGSEVRLLSQALKRNPYAKVKVRNEQSIHHRLRKLSQHIQYCIVADHELLPYVKDYYEQVHIIPSMIDLDAYSAFTSSQQNKKLRIVHAPTSPEIKGTKTILQTIEKLKNQYDFEFQLVQGKSHEEAKKIYQQADLIIDQLHIGSYGLFAVESMAMGKPVICHISDYMREHYPEDLPIIPANPDTLLSTLEHILKNQDMLQSVGLQSRKYVEQVHDRNKNSKRVLNLYQTIMRSTI